MQPNTREALRRRRTSWLAAGVLVVAGAGAGAAVAVSTAVSAQPGPRPVWVVADPTPVRVVADPTPVRVVAGQAPVRVEAGQDRPPRPVIAEIERARVRARLERSVRPLAEPYELGVSVRDHRTGVVWSYRGSLVTNLASVTKLTTAMALCIQVSDQGRQLSEGERSLVRQALQVSDNDAQHRLWQLIGGHEGYTEAVRRMGLTGTRPMMGYGWGRTLSTPQDQVRVMEILRRRGAPLREGDAEWIARTMRAVSSEQTWGAAPFGRTAGRVIEVKNGWSPYRDTGLWRLASVGRVTDREHDYTVSILSTGWESAAAGTPRLDAVGQAVYDALAHPAPDRPVADILTR